MTPIETPTGSSLDIQDDTLATSATESSLESHDHDEHDGHDHEGHDHEGHEHHHHAAPTLNPELTRSIEVDAPVEDVNKAFQKVTKRYTKLARIPGFRAGKVPESLIRSKFAKEVRQEVLESLVSERFRKAIDEQKLRPVSQPQIAGHAAARGAAAEVQGRVRGAPEINIDGYDAITGERPDAALTEDEFDAELSRVLDSHATVEPVEEDRALVDGDWAEIQLQRRG